MPAAARRHRRTEAPEVRRRQILDAARRRFCAAGFHATTMAEVAAEAGISVGLIYQHFPSKDALIEGIVQQDVDAQMEVIRAIFDEGPKTMAEAIRNGARAYIPMILDRARTAMMLEVVGEMVRNPKVRDFAADLEGEIRPQFQERLLRMKPEGWSDEKMFARYEVFVNITRGLGIDSALKDTPPSREVLQAVLETAVWLFTPEGASS
jgi:AcrR family transcriptional regulator